MKRSCIALISVCLIALLAVSAGAINKVPINAAKRLPAQRQVWIDDAVVTADQQTVDGSIFVEMANRAAGIRVVTDADVKEGDRIRFTGLVQKADGESQISGVQIIGKSAGTPLEPVVVASSDIARDPAERQSNNRRDNCGLLVSYTGVVTQTISRDSVIYVDDGSQYTDGLTIVPGIRVHLPEGTDVNQFDGEITVVGVLRIEKFVIDPTTNVNGRVYPPGSTLYVPSIWVRGKHSVPPPAGGLRPMTITWDPTKLSLPNIMELQILRDDQPMPVKTIRDPSAIDLGFANLAYLYGGFEGIPVSYYSLPSNPASSYIEQTWTVPEEYYGRTHTYQVAVLSQKVTADANVAYILTPAGNKITATAIEPVKAQDMIYPQYDPAVGPIGVFPSHLLSGEATFQWMAKYGADEYSVRISPVIPGSASTWESGMIYSSGDEFSSVVSLTYNQQMSLAAALASVPEWTELKMVVSCRNSGDTSQQWVPGDEIRFIIGALPPAIP